MFDNRMTHLQEPAQELASPECVRELMPMGGESWRVSAPPHLPPVLSLPAHWVALVGLSPPMAHKGDDLRRHQY